MYEYPSDIWAQGHSDRWIYSQRQIEYMYAGEQRRKYLESNEYIHSDRFNIIIKGNRWEDT